MGEFHRVEITPTLTGPDAPAKAPAQEASKPSQDQQPTTPAERPAYVPEKFWNAKEGKVDVEALSKSYGELEKRNSAKPADPKPSDPPKPKADEKPAGDGKSDDKKDGDKATGEGKGDKAPQEGQSYIPGVTNEDGQRFAQELTEGGQLSDASYDQLAKAGYPKPIVDAYIRGLQADQQAQVAEGNEIKNLAGGEAGYTAMSEWMVANLTAAEVAEYNEAVTSGKKSVIKLAVQGMHSRYKESVGETPNLLGGKGNNPSTGDVFSSRAEVTKAMRDPRYRTDEAYRKSVSDKLGRSSI